MRRFFDLIDDRESLTRWHLDSPTDPQGKEIDPWQFLNGGPLALGCVPRIAIQHEGLPLDFTWAGLSTTPVVTQRFVHVLEQLGILPEVQLIPARVEGQPGPHFLLNVLNLIRCIDEARCHTVRYWKPEDGEPERVGQYKTVYGLKVDPSRIGAAHLFRAWGWRVTLFVSGELKDALQQEGVSGLYFIPV